METSPDHQQASELAALVADTVAALALSEYFNNLTGRDQLPFTD